MLIWTNYNTFAITHIIRFLQKFHFPRDVVLNSIKAQKRQELVFRPHFL